LTEQVAIAARQHAELATRFGSLPLANAELLVLDTETALERSVAAFDALKRHLAVVDHRKLFRVIAA
jgi:hypothetical protein